MVIRETHIVPESTEKSRLSDYGINIFISFPSRKGIYKAIKRGEVFVNGETGSTGTWITPGAKIDLVDLQINPPKEFEISLKIIYEDEFIAVIDKPPGFEVSGNKYRTVENSLSHNIKKSSEPDALKWPRPVHRLDKPTSGLLIIAKTTSAQIDLGHQFENKKIKKRYRAVVIGKVDEKGFIDTPVNGLTAKTKFSPVRSVPSLKNKWLSLLDLHPATGRKHQLRIHLSEKGFPILGDKTYGVEGMILKGKGMFLCAVELTFTHPNTKKEINIKIDDPRKFRTFLDREKKRWIRRNPEEIKE